MALRFALAGNPNSGKTTLFNRLTGSSAHVGNWPGVTVERREGKYKKSSLPIQIIDLPGIYSTSPYSPEEVVARNYIIEEKPDLIINIVDSTNLERNLYLTTELLETDRPVVIALNMMDEAVKSGYKVDTSILTKKLGVPVVPVSAVKGTGVKELMDVGIAAAKKERSPFSVLVGSNIYPGVESIQHIIGSNFKDNMLYRSVKLLENDSLLIKQLNKNRAEQVTEIQNTSKPHCKQPDLEAEIADLRYQYITKNLRGAVVKPKNHEGLSRSDKMDRILTNRILGIPIFVIILGIIFFLTFGEIGEIPMPGVWLQGLTEELIGFLGEGIGGLLESAGAAGWTQGLILDGIIGGVGGVLSFVPQILLLFLFISILEGTGYMARAAFIMDRLLRRFGLSGKSFVPMLMGFGCSVPAVMATRTIENEKDRRLTIMLTPFMSCGAKLPVYGLFAAAFFGDISFLGISGSVWAILGIYILGILVAVLSGMILKRTAFKGEAAPFIMELPAYRFPAIKNLISNLWEKLKHFLVKAGTIILLATIVIWFLQSFSFNLQMVEDNQYSILGTLGTFIAPIFKPLGFGTWQAVVSILTGFIAKEVVVSTLGVLYGSQADPLENETAMDAAIAAILTAFSPIAAFSFMAFNLLAPPCTAAMATIAQEMRSKKWTAFTIGFQICVAWVVSLIIYQGGTLISSLF